MPKPNPLRFAVLQPGARLHYAVPAILERAGMLQRFYTDFCANVGATRFVGHVWPTCLRPTLVHRMFGRTLPPNLSAAKVRQVRGAVVAWHIGRKLGFEARTGSVSDAVMKRARADHFGGANAIYTVIVNDDIDLCQEAKARGYRIVHEAMLNPDIGLHLAEEYQRFPEIPWTIPSLDQVEDGRKRDRRKYEIADLILVPSEFVYRSVIALGADPSKVAIVPYGINGSWLDAKPNPIPGRVLFVGTVGLLKGNHYLAAASRILRERNVACDIRVVGPVAKHQIRDPLFEGPHYVGQVPRASVQNEFLAADVFVLPTLSEGFALAHLEAMACAVPVITTPNCGSVVRNGIDGFIVPIRDPEALADVIKRIVTNRDLRSRMSQNARARAREHTWEKYGERLLHAFSKLESSGAEQLP
ncbi:group 1 glycosyl transferase [Hyphomicrobium denitrificans 1NES1]|uniref:Group 1 glycosyl transferase n=1 Tax=Hyphomicrobium denitrificans 1NES1 TaxID=670307 RepID=N0B349_9HYPH|nr:glycosyltransferase family 4 protein [Hyphomicrobium denitrificans]AGK56627.1 group 1 glycosyl transferase [Hyphomicrobium denitrificans 1NES1]